MIVLVMRVRTRRDAAAPLSGQFLRVRQIRSAVMGSKSVFYDATSGRFNVRLYKLFRFNFQFFSFDAFNGHLLRDKRHYFRFFLLFGIFNFASVTSQAKIV